MRGRLSRLSEASLRINESLDFNAVLQEVLDSARSLTAARYGVITLHDDTGTAADFLSSGMTPTESDRLWTMPGWPQHFQYLAAIPSPLRVPDLLEHIRSLGLPELRPPLEVSEKVSFLAAPVLHRGQRVGSIYLAEKEHGQGVHAGGRRDAGAVRLPGGDGNRQCRQAPGRAAGQGRPWRR